MRAGEKQKWWGEKSLQEEWNLPLWSEKEKTPILTQYEFLFTHIGENERLSNNHIVIINMDFYLGISPRST